MEAIDNLSGNEEHRSEFIEAAVQAHIARVRLEDTNMKDLDIINNCADSLNEEALDVLDYQESR